MGGVTSAIGNMFSSPKAKGVPGAEDAKAPAVAAPTRREETGANIVLGSDAASRVTRKKSSSTGAKKSGDVLGGLGRGGLSI